MSTTTNGSTPPAEGAYRDIPGNELAREGRSSVETPMTTVNLKSVGYVSPGAARPSKAKNPATTPANNDSKKAPIAGHEKASRSQTEA
jgi:hypothetical protein